MYTIQLPGKYFYDDEFIDSVYELADDVFIYFVNNTTIVEIDGYIGDSNSLYNSMFNIIDKDEELNITGVV